MLRAQLQRRALAVMIAATTCLSQPVAAWAETRVQAPGSGLAGQAQTGPSASPVEPYAQNPSARLQVRVIDGRTRRPIQGAEVVLIETEQRRRTDADGLTGWFRAPIIRNPRYRPLVAELHGQLGVIAYKNGYRDSIHLGIRIHDEGDAETTVWMYRLGPGDARIEPVMYEEPYHRIWLIELADRFRRDSQIGEGPEQP